MLEPDKSKPLFNYGNNSKTNALLKYWWKIF